MKRLLVMVMVWVGMAAAAEANVIEDFEDGDVSDYTITAGGIPLFETSAAAAHDGELGLVINDALGWAFRDDPGVQVAQGDTISVWLNLGSNPGGRAYLGFGATPAGTMSLVAAVNTGDLRFQANPGYGFVELNTSPQVWEPNKWYRLEVIWGVGGVLEGNLYDSDGVTLLNTVSDVDNTFSSGGIAVRAFGGSDTFFDTVELPTEDSDGDGIPDDEDACPDSDLADTIVIDDCDSGVFNLLFDDGCTMSDLIAECAESASNHGQFVSCVSQLTNEWKSAGLITGHEKAMIVVCAAQSDIPEGNPSSVGGIQDSVSERAKTGHQKAGQNGPLN